MDSWTVTENGRNATIDEFVSTEKGKPYRAQAIFTVWIDGKAESQTITIPPVKQHKQFQLCICRGPWGYLKGDKVFQRENEGCDRPKKIPQIHCMKRKRG